jgi:ADP-heptose:LPS heptosyltransferase
LLIKRIIISRTDSIGDVMLTLPLCAWVKENYKGVHLIFLGNNYTKPVLECYSAVDEVVDWKEIEKLSVDQQLKVFAGFNADAIIHVFPSKKIATLAKKAKINIRIGTSHRLFHFWTCSQKVNFTRNKSPLHEAQLNFELLRPLGLSEIPSIENVSRFTSLFTPPNENLPAFIDENIKASKNIVILHPKSQGSAVEWGLGNYDILAKKLVEKGSTVFFTGTEKEGEQFRKNISFSKNILDTSGQLSLKQLIFLISKCNGFVACSTGPLHISGFLNVRTVGLFSPRRPIHPGRWGALGQNVRILVNDENCENCKKGKLCKCIELIAPERVLLALL